MPLFNNPFSIEIPLKIGRLNTVFFINNNLFVNNQECTSVPHCHHDYEIRYLSSGECNQIINRKSYPLKAGELLLIHPQEYHHQNSNNDSTQFNIRFSLTPPNDSDSNRQKAYEYCNSLLLETRRMKDENGLLHLYLERFTQEIYHKDEGYGETLYALCVMIFIEFLRLTNKPLIPIFPPNDYYYRGINRTKIDEFFREKYLKKVKISDLAEDMCISERQVNRYMHKMFGLSFTRKLLDMRLEKAASLLTESELPIQDIIQNCGFQSSKYFYQSFKTKFNVSPTQYREENKRYSKKN